MVAVKGPDACVGGPDRSAPDGLKNAPAAGRQSSHTAARPVSQSSTSKNTGPPPLLPITSSPDSSFSVARANSTVDRMRAQFLPWLVARASQRSCDTSAVSTSAGSCISAIHGPDAPVGLASGLNRGSPSWPEPGLRRETGLMQPGHGINRPQRPGTCSRWPARPSSEPARPSGLDNGTDLAEKAATAMYEDDEDRIDAAEQLAERNPHAAAEALSAIACDQAVGDEVRLSAAELLADLDARAAAPACLVIARDGMVGDEVRLSAAELLAAVDPRSAAPACLAIACDQEVGDEVRLSAAELLADADPHAAAPACLAIARDRTVGDEVRLAASEHLAALDPSA